MQASSAGMLSCPKPSLMIPLQLSGEFSPFLGFGNLPTLFQSPLGRGSLVPLVSRPSGEQLPQPNRSLLGCALQGVVWPARC